jgi:hypothetical protein
MNSIANKSLTVMAFGAHPDPFDMPYQAGGTLASMPNTAIALS